MCFEQAIKYTPQPEMLQVTSFQASIAVYMRSSLFWDVTQRTLVVSYRRFGTIYRSYIQGSSRRTAWLLNRVPTAWTLSIGIGFPETSVPTNLRCVTSPKSGELTYKIILFLLSVRFFIRVFYYKLLLTHFSQPKSRLQEMCGLHKSTARNTIQYAHF
jgi:hypothetical protein